MRALLSNRRRPLAVTVVGYGAMGAALAANLSRAGWRVLASDIAPNRARLAASRGHEVVEAEDLGAAAAPYVVTSLPSPKALGEVVDRLVSSSGGHTALVVETSTLAVDDKRRVRAHLSSAGIAMVDCPLSGTASQASTRDVVAYASGEADDVRRSMALLEAIARHVVNAGPFGAGTTLKLLANHLVLVHTAAAAEMLAVARAAGLAPGWVLDAVGAGAGGSRMLEVRGPAMAAREYDGWCAIEMLCKDGSIIRDFVTDNAISSPLLNAAIGVFEVARAAGLGHLDGAAVHEHYVDERRRGTG